MRTGGATAGVTAGGVRLCNRWRAGVDGRQVGGRRAAGGNVVALRAAGVCAMSRGRARLRCGRRRRCCCRRNGGRRRNDGGRRRGQAAAALATARRALAAAAVAGGGAAAVGLLAAGVEIDVGLGAGGAAARCRCRCAAGGGGAQCVAARALRGRRQATDCDGVGGNAAVRRRRAAAAALCGRCNYRRRCNGAAGNCCCWGAIDGWIGRCCRLQFRPRCAVLQRCCWLLQHVAAVVAAMSLLQRQIDYCCCCCCCCATVTVRVAVAMRARAAARGRAAAGGQCRRAMAAQNGGGCRRVVIG